MKKATLQGQQVVITGQPEAFSRAGASQMIKDAGGEMAGTIDLHTTILVVCTAGHPISQRKLDHARMLGVQIMAEASFLKLLRGT